MSIAEAGKIAQGYLVADQVDDADTFSCIRDVSIIGGIMCYYTEDEEYAGYMVNHKKEEDLDLFELEISDIYKERMFYQFWNWEDPIS